MSKPIPWYKGRHLRTIILAIIATATLVGAAILIFDVRWQVMLNLFLASLLGLAIVIAAALAATGVYVVLRRWWEQR